MNTELTTTAIAPMAPVTPMTLVEIAVNKGASIEQIQQLMDLKERWEAGESRKAFVAAMAAFKAESIRITKDKDNKQYSSKYVSLGNLVTTVTPYLSKHGLSARWDVDQAQGIKVTCIVTHSMGHSESVSMTCPPDKSGAKNPIQEIKSAITYAKACTFESICGLASTDANVDDDGNGVQQNAMPEPEYCEWMDAIQQAPNAETLRETWKKAMVAAERYRDNSAKTAFIKAKDKAKEAL